MKKKVLILGGDGYIGWPTAMKLSRAGHDVTICDNFNKRKWELEIGVKPLVQLPILQDRIQYWEKCTGYSINLVVGDLTNQRFVYDLFEWKPDVIVHCADQPSAPFSMKGINTAVTTQMNNIITGLNILFALKRSCPEALYVRLGSSSLADGENVCSKDTFAADSFYELSRVHDYNNLYFSCKNWMLKAAVVNTGVVYDVTTEETVLHENLQTAFHYDRVFGTVVNRFCVQAVVGMPLTLYGDGKHRCGFTLIQDTVDAIALVVEQQEIVAPGDIKTCNAFGSIMSLNQAAGFVQDAIRDLGIDVSVEYIENPRKEFVEQRERILSKSVADISEELDVEVLRELIKKIVETKNNILEDSILPVIKWFNI